MSVQWMVMAVTSNAALPSASANPRPHMGMLIGAAVMVVCLATLELYHFILIRGKTKQKRRYAPNAKDSVSRLAEKQSITFHDVAGNEAAKEQLLDIVDFLAYPSRYQAQGAKLPRGILLTGAPGVGKTLLAKAMAGEAGVPFFSASGSDFQEIYVGVGAKRIRELFGKAREHAPCVVFIDEFDGLARKREDAHEESARTLNAFLTEMDGFAPDDAVVVIAATNFPELLDHAATRPGRFDRHVEISPPDALAREEILRLHARNKRIGDVNFQELARRTAGMSGAHLAAVMNEAAILSVKDRSLQIDASHIDEALARVIAGLKHTRADSTIRSRIAVHEAGHAIAALALGRTVEYVTIQPRGRVLGYVFYSEGKDGLLLTQAELETEIMILLGGRAAKFVCLQDRSTGAANDIERATELTRRMITVYGMGDDLVASKSADQETGARLREYDERVRRMIERHREAHRILAERLLEEELVNGDTIQMTDETTSQCVPVVSASAILIAVNASQSDRVAPQSFDQIPPRACLPKTGVGQAVSRGGEWWYAQ
ncbi:MAG: AAA family ATPase [Bacilli bacterium]